MGKEPLFESTYEHNGELKPLGRMKSHQLDTLLVLLSLVFTGFE